MKLTSTRRSLLRGAAAMTALGAVGINPRFVRPAFAQGLAAGMTGGPSGFAGAERFQYDESMSEGRAIEAMKRMVAEGRAPARIIMLLTDGAIGQITQPFPSGPSVKDVWEAETGVELEIIGAPAGDIWARVLQDVTTNSGAFDIYTHPWNSLGDLVEAGGAANLDDYVAAHRPDWADEERGTPTAQTAELLCKYGGSYYGASLDGDFQTWVYNKQYFDEHSADYQAAHDMGGERPHQRLLHRAHRPRRCDDLWQRQRHGAVLGVAAVLCAVRGASGAEHVLVRRERPPEPRYRSGDQGGDRLRAIARMGAPRRPVVDLCRGLFRHRQRPDAASDDPYQRHQICRPPGRERQPGEPGRRHTQRLYSPGVQHDEFVALLGPSGCGKSTTMNMIAGIEAPTSGAIRFDGRDVTAVPMARRGVGFVFQNYAIFTHLTVRANLAFGLEVTGTPRAEVDRRVGELAEFMALTHRLDAPSAALSVNEMQKLAIGRSAIVAPAILLLDEPLSNLDAAFRERMRSELRELQRNLRQTMVYVTHDQIEAMGLADRIAVMDNAVLQQFATPAEIYARPRNTFVAGFIGAPSMNLIPVRIAGGRPETPTGDIALDGRLAAQARAHNAPDLLLGVRPEDVAIAAVGIGARIALVETVGRRRIAHFDGAGCRILGTYPRTLPLTTGEPVHLAPDLAKAHLFDPATGLRLTHGEAG